MSFYNFPNIIIKYTMNHLTILCYFQENCYFFSNDSMTKIRHIFQY